MCIFFPCHFTAGQVKDGDAVDNVIRFKEDSLDYLPDIVVL